MMLTNSFKLTKLHSGNTLNTNTDIYFQPENTIITKEDSKAEKRRMTGENQNNEHQRTQ